MDLRTLQKEVSLALAYYKFNSNEMAQFNKAMDHDSSKFYKSVLDYYMKEFNGLPSETGPAKDIILKYD